MKTKVKKDITRETADGKITRLPGSAPLLKESESGLFASAELKNKDLKHHDDDDDSKFNPKELEMGIQIELEHTNDKDIAKQIAKDHLNEFSDYYTRLKAMESKAEREEVKKTLFERWADLKKALDNNAIATVDDIIGDDESKDEEDQSSDDQSSDEQNPSKDESNPSDNEDDQGSEDQSEDNEMNPEDNVPIHELIPDEDESNAKMIDALREHGYTDSEIAHIVHGHTPPQNDPVDSAKVNAINGKSNSDSQSAQLENDIKSRLMDIEHKHKQSLNDVELDDFKNQKEVTKMKNDHAKKMMELEYEHTKKKKELELQGHDNPYDKESAKIELDHKKRMLDLEYEIEKQIKMLEIEQRKHEMEMKLRQAKDNHKAKQETNKEKAKMKEEEPEEKEEKEVEEKPIKKSEEEDFESLEKRDVGNWKYDEATKQYNHDGPHGSMAIHQNKDYSFSLIHNGKEVFSKPNIREVHSHMVDRMKGLDNQDTLNSGGSIKFTPGTKVTYPGGKATPSKVNKV